MKASDIFEVDYLMSNGEYTGWYLRSLENGRDVFKTKEQAEALLSKWDSVEALEERVRELESQNKTLEMTLEVICDQYPEIGRAINKAAKRQASKTK